MKRIVAVVLLTLAACGVDGPPTPPAGSTAGIAISGHVEMGIGN